MAEPGFIRVGEAAFALDPLSSQGVRNGHCFRTASLGHRTRYAAAPFIHAGPEPIRTTSDFAVRYYGGILAPDSLGRTCLIPAMPG